jgi:hypothetical protein
MSGYTGDALRDVLRGQQPDMLLLDRCGRIPAADPRAR